MIGALRRRQRRVVRRYDVGASHREDRRRLVAEIGCACERDLEGRSILEHAQEGRRVDRRAPRRGLERARRRAAVAVGRIAVVALLAAEGLERRIATTGYRRWRRGDGRATRGRRRLTCLERPGLVPGDDPAKGRAVAPRCAGQGDAQTPLGLLVERDPGREGFELQERAALERGRRSAQAEWGGPTE